MPLPNPDMEFTPFDTLPAADLNDLVENIEALAAGTGHDASSIPASAIDFGGAGSGIWWQEIGRTTLVGAGDTISLTSLPARKYLMLLIAVQGTGGTISLNLRFNNDSGSSYAERTATNGATDSGTANQSSVIVTGATTYANLFYSCEIINIAAQEKIGYGRRIDPGTAGAPTAPGKAEQAFKWANTSNQITRVDVLNLSGAGDLASGSELIVLGHN